MGQQALGYIRVSKAREEMISPELQEAAIADWCARNQATLIRTITDLDATGRNFARTGIQEAITAVERGEANLVVVWKWSRFGRNVRDCLVNIDRLEVAGGRLVAATEDFDDTPVGRFGRGQFLLMAQFESERIGEQWKEAQSRRVRQGLPPTGLPRYGYVYDPDRRLYEQNPDTADLLRSLYQRYNAGESVSRLVQWLNANRIPTSTGTGAWYQTALHSILDSGFAAGLVTYHGELHPGQHEPIIDQTTWDTYQRTRRLRAQRFRTRQANPVHFLSGLVYCATCHRAMIRSGTDRLSCGQRGPAIGQRCPLPAHITSHAAEDAVKEWLFRIAANISAAGEVAAQQRATKKDTRSRATRLTREMTRLEAALTRLTRQVAEGLVPLQAYTATRDSLLHDLTTVTTELQKVQDEAAALTQPIPRLVLDLTRDWDRLDVLGQREVLAAVVRRVAIRSRRDPADGPRVQVHPVWEPDPWE